MSKYSLTPVSRNSKTGPMPVVTASSDTCPTDCPLKDGGGCYAEHGPLRIHWNNVDQDGFDFDELLKRIRRLPRNQSWRYGQAGDLPKPKKQVLQLAKANNRRPAIAFTHGRDFETYHEAAKLGLNINLSCETLAEADVLSDTGLPVVVVLPSFYGRQKGESLTEFRKRVGIVTTPAGRRVAICPATYTETNCLLCQACSKARPGEAIIGFPAHGTKKKQVDDRVDRRSNPWPVSTPTQTFETSSMPSGM